MQKKVVIIGSNGLLGQSLVNRLHKDTSYKVYAMASGANRNSTVSDLNYLELSLSDISSLKIQLNLIEPDFIINAIAMTNVDACEVEQKACYDVNVRFVKDLAIITQELKAFLIHISTDFIFDGNGSGMYKETDKANPVNYYGLSKVKSEKVVIDNCTDYSILRTILVYGKVANMKRSNIVLWVKNALEKKEALTIVNDQYRMPTFVGSIVEACILTMEKRATGIYHISGNELLSIYEIALQVAAYYKLDKSLIRAIDSTELNQRAKRPAKTGFTLDMAIKKLGFKPLSLHEGLDRMNLKKMNID